MALNTWTTVPSKASKGLNVHAAVRRYKDSTQEFVDWLILRARRCNLHRHDCLSCLLHRPNGDQKYQLKLENFAQVAQFVTSHGPPEEIPAKTKMALQRAIEDRRLVHLHYADLHGGRLDIVDRSHANFISALEAASFYFGGQ